MIGQYFSSFSDLLFGVCDNGAGLRPGEVIFRLDQVSLNNLENKIISLVKNGFTWQDPYTQCTLQNLILAYIIELPFHKSTCSGLVFDYSDPVQKEISSALASLLEEALQTESGNEYQPALTLLPTSSKRDEIIRVHKYFDKSTGINKRKFFPSTSSENYLDYYPFDDVVDFYPREIPQNYANIASASSRGGWENSGIPLEDILLAREYLQANQEREKSKYGSKLAELLDLKGYTARDVPMQEALTADLQPVFEVEEEPQPGYSWTKEDETAIGPLEMNGRSGFAQA